MSKKEGVDIVQTHLEFRKALLYLKERDVIPASIRILLLPAFIKIEFPELPLPRE